MFLSLAANEYNALVVAPEFLTGGSWNSTDLSPYYTAEVADIQIKVNSSNFEKLEKPTCVKSYGIDFVSARRNVVLVSTTSNSTNTLYFMTESYVDSQAYNWICQDISVDGCNPADILNSIDTWTIEDKPIDYCLSEVLEEKCKLQFSLYIMIIVIFCNFVKATALALC